MLGDKARAETALAGGARRPSPTRTTASRRRDYGTGVRDGAALITLASETRHRQGRGAAPRRRGRQGLRGQDLHLDAGAGVDAAGRARARRGGRQRRRSSVNGAAAQGPAHPRAVAPPRSKAGALIIANDGDAPVDAVVSVIGAALTPEPAVSKGFTIERTYYTLDGKKVDLKSATGGTAELKQNERLVVVVKVRVAGDRRPHPAGRPAAGRPRDREPAPRRLRRHQDARLAEDHA